MKIALQLYTTRDCIKDKQSFFDTLEKVKSIGYDGVEFAGFYGVSAKELKEKLALLGLTPVSSHQSADALKNDLDNTYDYLIQLGCPNVALAWYDTSTAENTAELCQIIVKSKAKADELGLNFHYHNHDHEFYKNDGGLPIDAIKKVCSLELDTFWVFASGNNPVEYLKQNKDNVGLVHLKDGGKASKIPCALGEGENNIKAIYDATKAFGYEWIIVENDTPTPDGIQDITRSINYLKTI